MKMDVGISLPKVALVAIAVVAIACSSCCSPGSAGRPHYGNCLEKAALEHPADRPAGRADSRQVAREEAISSCSRWP